jgi:hypothetical protein
VSSLPWSQAAIAHAAAASSDRTIAFIVDFAISSSSGGDPLSRLVCAPEFRFPRVVDSTPVSM